MTADRSRVREGWYWATHTHTHVCPYIPVGTQISAETWTCFRNNKNTKVPTSYINLSYIFQGKIIFMLKHLFLYQASSQQQSSLVHYFPFNLILHSIIFEFIFHFTLFFILFRLFLYFPVTCDFYCLCSFYFIVCPAAFSTYIFVKTGKHFKLV